MDFHSIGASPSSQPASQRGEGASAAVVQFVQLVRGVRGVRKPVHRFRVQTVEADELYCLKCCDVRWHDVARDAGQQMVWKRCRACGEECA